MPADTAETIRQFQATYVYQSYELHSSLVQTVLARVKAAVAAMTGVEVVFVTSLQDATEDHQAYVDHSHQPVTVFLDPMLTSVENGQCFDEECLPYYRVRFADGVELLADDSELFGTGPAFQELINAVSGAFACARELDFIGLWALAADGSDADKALFLEKYASFDIGTPPTHWAMNAHTPARSLALGHVF